MAPNFRRKWANFSPLTPNRAHIRENPVVTPTTTTRKERAIFLWKLSIFMGRNAFSFPHLVTGFWKRQNPDTRYGHIGQFWPKVLSVYRDTRSNSVALKIGQFWPKKIQQNRDSVNILTIARFLGFSHQLFFMCVRVFYAFLFWASSYLTNRTPCSPLNWARKGIRGIF